MSSILIANCPEAELPYISEGDSEMEILDGVPIEFDRDALLAKLHIDKEGKNAEDIQDLIEAVAPAMKPKAIYEVSYIHYKNYDTVDIGGVIFVSRVLRVNLDKVQRVFPYIATCGRELDEIAIPSDDLLRRFWLDSIKEMVLDAMRKYLTNHLKERYALEELSRMSPGSGSQDLWPIEQQRQLFSIFGNVEDLIEVTLTDSFLMIPLKSVSGIYFPTEIRFESCQLCPRKVCPGRRAPYDKSLLESYYKERG
jgi:hypothetical protein